MTEEFVNELMTFLVPAALGGLGILVGFFWGRIKAYAKSTPAQWDDRLVEVISDVMEARKDEWMLAGKKKAEQELALMLQQANVVFVDEIDASDDADLNVVPELSTEAQGPAEPHGEKDA